MSASRREFLKMSMAAGSLSIIGQAHAAPARPGGKRLLILGGTGFLGPHLVDAARKDGFTVTLFNRGKTNPHLFPDVETLLGDRDGNLKALAGRQWDAVVDTSGYVPRLVRDSAELLKKAVHRYVFISTVSVYKDTSKPGMDETAPVGALQDPTVEEIGGGTYGPLKALCEQAAERAMPGRTTVIRPGLIVGPRDQSDRFTYWPVRIARGGEVLAPGTADDPIQLIDVRDLAEWTLRMIEGDHGGTYNALGPAGTLIMADLLHGCKVVSGSDAHFTWVDGDFLEQHKVSAWSDMPVWAPPSGDSAGFARMSNKRALARGLSFRPLAVTIADTLAWWKTLPPERQAKMHAGLSLKREAEVLAAWRGRSHS